MLPEAGMQSAIFERHRRTVNGASLEIGRGIKMDSPHQQSRGPEWMQPEKIIVISIADKMRIKIPGPGHSRINPPSFEGGTMKEIAL